MPDARGGARPPDSKARPVSGPGKYAQRTDLSQPGPKPPGQGVYAPSGGAYGSRQRIEQAQASVPAPALRSPPPQPQPQGRPPGSAAAPQIPTLAQILARPTNRPTEPSTAGIPTGPGPNQLVSAPAPSISGIIEQAARATGNPDLLALAQRAQSLGQ